MKKLYLLIVLVSFFSNLKSQNVSLPNPGFEFWTQVGNRPDPDNWNTLNPSTAILGVYTATRASGADAHSGTYAIKLQTKNVFVQTANGIASTGTIITTPPYGVTGGIPYTGRPDSIAGWFKYLPQGTDSGFVQYLLQDSATLDTIGFVRWQTKNLTTGTYTRFSAPISYWSSATPNLSNWILSSSRASNPVVNSALYIDDLQLIFNPVVCSVPVNLSTLNITTTGAKLKWNPVPGTINYQQKYRAVGTTTWTYKTSTSANKVLTGLLPNTSYEWAVREKCSANPVTWSNYSVKKTFVTLSIRQQAAVDDIEQMNNELNIFPNPADELVNFSVMLEKDQLVTVTIFNAIGQAMMKKTVRSEDGMVSDQLNIASLNPGIYFITMDGDELHATKKLLKQ